MKTFRFLLSRMQALTSRLDSPRVVCDEKATAWDSRPDLSSIMSLNQHNVECPQGLFFARFQLKAETNMERLISFDWDMIDRVSYHYHCCKFIL